MDEYIKRIDANYAVTDAIWHGKRSMHDVASAINSVPSADVAPVRHGRWEKQSGLYSCSECGTTCPYDVQADVIEYWACNYCPNCGAKMDGGVD